MRIATGAKITLKWANEFRGHKSPHLTYKGNTIELTAGNDDDVTVYQEGKDLYVLTRNYGLGYVGLSIYNKADLAEAGDVFFQNPDQLELPKADPLDYSAPYLIRALSQYIY